MTSKPAIAGPEAAWAGVSAERASLEPLRRWIRGARRAGDDDPTGVLLALADLFPAIGRAIDDEGPRGEAARLLEDLVLELEERERAQPPALVDEEAWTDRPDSEKAVLRALQGSAGPLGRAEVRKRLDGSARGLTPQRIGQVLADLHQRGLLRRSERTLQGAKDASVYALSPVGARVAARLPEPPARRPLPGIEPALARELRSWTPVPGPPPAHRVIALLGATDHGLDAVRADDLAARLAQRVPVLLVDAAPTRGVPADWSPPGRARGLTALWDALERGESPDPTRFAWRDLELPDLWRMALGNEDRSELSTRWLGGAPVSRRRRTRPLDRLHRRLAAFDGVVLLRSDPGEGAGARVALALADAAVAACRSRELPWLERVAGALVGPKTAAWSDHLVPVLVGEHAWGGPLPLGLHERHGAWGRLPEPLLRGRGVSWAELVAEQGLIVGSADSGDCPLTDRGGEWVRGSAALQLAYELLVLELLRVAGHLADPDPRAVDFLMGMVPDHDDADRLRMAEGEWSANLRDSPAVLLEAGRRLVTERPEARAMLTGALRNGLMLRGGEARPNVARFSAAERLSA